MMEKLAVARSVLVVGILAAALFLLIQVNVEVPKIVAGVQEALAHANSTLSTVDDSAQKSAKYYELVGRQVPARLGQLKVLLERVDRSVKNFDRETVQLLKETQSAIVAVRVMTEHKDKETADLLAKLEAGLEETLTKAPKLIETSTETVAALKARVEDPIIDKLIKDAGETMEYGRASVKNIEETTASVTRTALVAEQLARKLAKPQALIVRAGMFVLGLGNSIYGWTKLWTGVE